MLFNLTKQCAARLIDYWDSSIRETLTFRNSNKKKKKPKKLTKFGSSYKLEEWVYSQRRWRRRRRLANNAQLRTKWQSTDERIVRQPRMQMSWHSWLLDSYSRTELNWCWCCRYCCSHCCLRSNSNCPSTESLVHWTKWFSWRPRKTTTTTTTTTIDIIIIIIIIFITTHWYLSAILTFNVYLSVCVEWQRIRFKEENASKICLIIIIKWEKERGRGR